MIKSALTATGALLLLVQLTSVDISIPVPSTAFGTYSEYVRTSDLSVVKQFTQASFAKGEVSQSHDALLFVGDVLLARNVEFLMRAHGSSYPYNGLKFDSFAAKPAVVGNFEAAVPLEHVPTRARQLTFSVANEFLPSLKEAGFTHLSLANNHSLDHGDEGFITTKQQLEEVDLAPFGSQELPTATDISFVTVDEIKIALVPIQAIETRLNEDHLQRVLESAAAKSDLQIAYIHWGIEYDGESSQMQRQTAAQLVAAGADIIIGHHPHVVQEVGIIDGVPVFYSLGNYIFDQYFSPDVMTGLLVQLSFKTEPAIHLIPVTSANTISQPRLMEAGDHADFLAELAAKSDPKIAQYIRNGKLPLQSLVASSSEIAMIY